MTDFYQKEKALLVEFEKLKPLLSAWGCFLDSRFLDILKERNFDLHRLQIPPKHRIKGDDSLIKKVFYRGKEPAEDALKNLKDKIGTRLVVTTLDEVKEVGEIIKSCENIYWKVVETRALDNYLLNPKEFDYQSLHLNLTPLDNVEGFEGVSENDREYYICEVQIRTLLQHAFAEVAHDTIYKGAFGSDKQLVRILSRGVALMETTDENFCSVYEIMKKEETYEKSFLSRLISISKEKLQLDFPTGDVDSLLTKNLFDAFEVQKIDISDVEKTVIKNEDLIKKAITRTRSYLRSQPVLLFIMYLIMTSSEQKMHDKWHLEGDILRDLYFNLGIATRQH